MSGTKKNINNEEFDTSIENGNFYDIKQRPEIKYITPAKKKLTNKNNENNSEQVITDSCNFNDYFSNLFVDNNSNDKKNVIINL